MRISRYHYASIMLLAALATAQDRPEELTPPFVSADVPLSGFFLLGADTDKEECMSSSPPAWTHASGTAFDLWVRAAGPSGTGRYWNITIGISERDAPEPLRGFCLTTSTIGWRTLERYSRTPLPWIADEDGDGEPEFVLWSSIPLHGDATNAEFALMGWVYSVNSSGNIRLNWERTRALAAGIAAEYRDPLDDLDASAERRRLAAAEMLERFSRTPVKGARQVRK